MFNFQMSELSWCEKKTNLSQLLTNKIVLCRQMVARTVLDTLRQVADVSNDIEAVFAIVARLAQDVGKHKLVRK